MLRIDTILAPVDFSPHSLPGAEHAAALAGHFGAKLVLLHAISPHPYAYLGFEGGYYGGANWPQADQIQAHLHRELDRLAEKVAAEMAVEKIVVEGDPAGQIAGLAEERKAGLIVMPTHGFGPFRRLLLGSVTTKVLHDVSGPVFTGAHIEELPTDDVHPYQHIACAIGPGDQSGTILRWAAQFAESYTARLAVLHAVPYREHGSVGERVREGRSWVEQLLDECHAEADDVIVESGDALDFVPTLVQERGAELLIIGRSQPEGLLGRLRTHAHALIRQSPCPVSV